MVVISEFRFGNSMLQKTGNKVNRIRFGMQQLELLVKGDLTSLYPVVLKPDLAEQCGFIENKQYPLLPDAREFKLILPVPGGSNSELVIYSKNNGECFGRATINAAGASVNFFHLHQLQNIYYALTGKELEVKGI